MKRYRHLVTLPWWAVFLLGFFAGFLAAILAGAGTLIVSEIMG